MAEQHYVVGRCSRKRKKKNNNKRPRQRKMKREGDEAKVHVQGK